MRSARALIHALRSIVQRITPAGRGVVLLTLLAWHLGHRYEWREFAAVAVLGALLMIASGCSLVISRVSKGSFRVVPTRTVVGGSAEVHASITAGFAPLLNPVLRAPVGEEVVQTRLPVVRPGREHEEVFVLPAHRRGVYDVGPLVHVRSDVLGFFQRFHELAPRTELRVRPRTVSLDSLGTGVIHDLEGVPSDQLSSSDMAFHALREYVPGDDLRHVHWRSSAKADSLLVRQYLESRRSHATVLIDHNLSAYAHPDDFELAVSMGASIAARAAQDDFQVMFVCGEIQVESHQPDVLLDAACRFGPGAEDFAARAMMTAGLASGTSLVAVLSGGSANRGSIHRAASLFPPEASRIVLCADPDKASHLSDAAGVMTLSARRLEHLPALLFRGTA